MAFEDKFGGEISDEDAQKITTVGEAVKYIDRTHVMTALVAFARCSIQKVRCLSRTCGLV